MALLAITCITARAQEFRGTTGISRDDQYVTWSCSFVPAAQKAGAVQSGQVEPTTTALPADIKTDQKAKDAVLALEKLQAKVESGIPYKEYRLALGDTYFAVKLFLKSDQAETSPEFSKALRNSMKWFQAAAELWERSNAFNTDSMNYSPMGFCTDRSGVGISKNYFAPEMCEAYPELVTTVTLASGVKSAFISYEEKPPFKLAAAELDKTKRYMK